MRIKACYEDEVSFNIWLVKSKCSVITAVIIIIIFLLHKFYNFVPYISKDINRRVSYIVPISICLSLTFLNVSCWIERY